MIAFVTLVVVCFVIGIADGRRAGSAARVVVAVVCLVLSVLVGPAPSLQLFCAVIIGFAWLTATARSTTQPT